MCGCFFWWGCCWLVWSCEAVVVEFIEGEREVLEGVGVYA